MTKYNYWREVPHALAVTALYVGAACAVFFSPPGTLPQAFIEPIPAALAATEPEIETLQTLLVAVVVPVTEETMPESESEPELEAVVIVIPQPVKIIPVVPPVVVAPVATQARLVIPSIDVNAVIKSLGYTSDGAMAIPANRIDVGWFKPGTIPGQIGSAVIGGHNEWTGGAGVFAQLHELRVGDRLTVIDTDGISKTFVVRETRTYGKNDDATSIFSPADGAYLNLITCSGIWDPVSAQYSTRLVVFTDLVVGI